MDPFGKSYDHVVRYRDELDQTIWFVLNNCFLLWRIHFTDSLLVRWLYHNLLCNCTGHPDFMSLIIDTSVVISVITNEQHKSQLIKITEGEDLIAPSSLHWEIGNAFSAMFKRRRIELRQVKKALEQYKMIPIRLVEVDLESSLAIAHKYNLYAYDAYFLDCAFKLNLPLLTLDGVLLNAARQIGIEVKEI